MPSILIIDDHLLLRQGLKQMLNQEHRGLVFGEAKSSSEAATCLAKRTWDIVVLDICIPGKDGFQILQEVRTNSPSTRVLMFSMHAEPQYAARARELRAAGYLCKNSSRAVLLRAFSAILAGKEYFADLDAAGHTAPPEPRHACLSARERAVMLSVASGKRTGEIAVELDLSVKTISTYKRRILDKLGLNSTADLVRYVIDQRLS